MASQLIAMQFICFHFKVRNSKASRRDTAKSVGPGQAVAFEGWDVAPNDNTTELDIRPVIRESEDVFRTVPPTASSSLLGNNSPRPSLSLESAADVVGTPRKGSVPSPSSLRPTSPSLKAESLAKSSRKFDKPSTNNRRKLSQQSGTVKSGSTQQSTKPQNRLKAHSKMKKRKKAL